MDSTLEFIQKHRFDDIGKLAFSYSKSKDIDLNYALTQIAGRQSIKNKIPSWYEIDDISYPQHLSLEQCSSEATAKYKASLIKGDSLIDLTGGFGIDCAFLSPHFKNIKYIERQQSLCDITRKNFDLLGLNHIDVIRSDSVDYLPRISNVDCIYLDPARRNNSGKKIVAIQDCEPDITQIKEDLLTKSKTVMIKLSPMLDIGLALQSLPETFEIHVVSVAGECKELLFLLQNKIVENIKITCINLLKNGKVQSFSFNKKDEENALTEYTSEPEKYIYEPNASCLKSGAYKSIASKYNLKKFHSGSHLYTSSVLIENFPGRIFNFASMFSFNKKELKEQLSGLKQANISIRNFPGTVDDLRKKLKLNDGGNIYLFATTLANGNKVIIKVVNAEW